MQFTFSRISTIIGMENYQKLIVNNNQYYDSLATIPLTDFLDAIPEFEIHIDDKNDPNKHLSIHNILQSIPWCIHVEPTQTDGKILIVTTKNQLSNARQWLDSNLKPLFKHHLTKNKQYQALPTKMVPCRLDRITTMDATLDYAKKLLTKIPAISDDTKKKFAKTPAHNIAKPNQHSYDSKQFPPLSTNTIVNQPNSTNELSAGSAMLTQMATAPTTTQANSGSINNFNNMQHCILQTMQLFQQDFHCSMANIDWHYDQLLHEFATFKQQVIEKLQTYD